MRAQDEDPGTVSGLDGAFHGSIAAEHSRCDPGEYLDLGVDIKKGMPPRTPVSVTLEIVEPDKSAVSFVFEPQ